MSLTPMAPMSTLRRDNWIKWLVLYTVVFVSQMWVLVKVGQVVVSVQTPREGHHDDATTVASRLQIMFDELEQRENEVQKTSESLKLNWHEKEVLNTSQNTPGVVDLYGEIEKYLTRVMSNTNKKDSIDEVSAHQLHSTVKDMQVDTLVHFLGDVAGRLEYIQRLHTMMAWKRMTTKVCIAATINHDAASMESKVLPWIQYHVEMGINTFYIMYDGNDPEALRILSRLDVSGVTKATTPIVSVINVKKELGAPEQLQNAYKVFYALYDHAAEGNQELMKKQKFCVEEAIHRGQVAHAMDWIIQIDVDELFLPTRYHSIPATLESIPKDIPGVRFMNVESQAESGDVQHPFLQHTLFRMHKYLTPPEANRYRSTFKQGLNSGYITLYANGKSAARLGKEWNTKQFGPHYFTGTPNHDPSSWVNIVSNDAYILHYCYINPKELIEKAKRSCPKYYGKRVDYDTVKSECFIMDMDARSFMAANTGNISDAIAFYYQNFVLSEGAPVRCTDSSPPGWCSLLAVEKLKVLLQRLGLMERFMLPQQILSRQEVEMQAARNTNCTFV